MSAPLRVSIVMATYNKADMLRATLDSIFVQKVPFSYEVVVVDDGSTDHTPEVLSQYPVVTERLDRQGHLGSAKPRNRAIQLSQASTLILQSDDVIHFSPNTIELLTVASEEQPTNAIFARVYNVVHKDGIVLKRIGSYLHPGRPRKQRGYFFLGAIQKSVIYSVGGNDESFTHAGYEDTWLRDCLVNTAGCELVHLWHPIGYHQHHGYTKDIGPDLAQMKIIFKDKQRRAIAGEIPWKAEISSLYDNA